MIANTDFLKFNLQMLLTLVAFQIVMETLPIVFIFSVFMSLNDVNVLSRWAETDSIWINRIEFLPENVKLNGMASFDRRQDIFFS